MSSRNRHLTLVSAATKLLAALLAVGPPLVYVGGAEPYLSPPPRVLGAADPLLFIGLGFALVVLIRPENFLRTRYWQATASEAGLSPERGDRSTFTGTVRGREVRAQIGSNSAFGSGANGFFENDGASARYTLVEAQLDTEATDGVVIGPAEQQFRLTPYDIATFADVGEDGLVALSNRDGLARAVLTDDVREALLAVEDLNQVYAGNAKAAADTLPENDRVPRGTSPKPADEIDAAHDDDLAGGHWLGGSGWVSHVSKGSVLDADQLETQLDAVVAVAEAFEEATQDD